MRLAKRGELETIEDVRLHTGASLESLERREQISEAWLPADHERALLESNGVEAYGGYIRLFGVDTIEATDAFVWNRADHWKFAWQDRCASF
jgi:hypothetical protein